MSQLNPNNGNTEATFRAWLIMWGALLMSCVMFALMAWFVAQPTQLTGGENFIPLFPTLLLTGLGTLAASFALKKKQLNQAIQEQSPTAYKAAISWLGPCAKRPVCLA